MCQRVQMINSNIKKNKHNRSVFTALTNPI